MSDYVVVEPGLGRVLPPDIAAALGIEIAAT